MNRHLTVSDEFGDLDAALSFAVQTLDKEAMAEVSIKIDWYTRMSVSVAEALTHGEGQWVEGWSVSVSGTAVTR